VVRKPHLSNPWAGSARHGPALLLAGLCCVPLPVLGADLGVQVLEKATGQPIVGASVCLGTPAEPMQLGGLRTPANGRVTFSELPAAALTLVVASPGRRPERRTIAIGQDHQVVTLLLARGQGSSWSCNVPAPRPEPTVSATRISGFRINNGAPTTNQRQVRLDFRSPEGANSYRASESARFAGAHWQPLSRRPAFELSAGAGTKTIFLQVRRYRQVQGASLETRSATASASIELE